MVQLDHAIPSGYYAAKEGYRVQDYRLGSSSLADLKPAKLTFWSHQIQYNQLDVHPMSCTIFAAAGAISDLTGYRFSPVELRQMVSAARNYGFSDDGWYVNAATDFVRRWWRNKRLARMASYLVWLNSPTFAEVLRKGYSVVTGYRGNSQYNDDVAADGMLDNINIVDTTYGHAIRMVQDQAQPDHARLVIDNYVDYNRHNLYRIKLNDLPQLVEKGVFFSTGYIFTNTMSNQFDDVPRNEQTEWYYSCVEWAAKEGLMSGYSDGTFRPNDAVTRAQMSILLKKLYDKLTPEPPAPPEPPAS